MDTITSTKRKSLWVNMVPFECEIHKQYTIQPVESFIGRYRLVDKAKDKKRIIKKTDIYKTPSIRASKNYDAGDLFRPKKNRRLDKEKELLNECLENYRKEKLLKENLYLENTANTQTCSRYFKNKDLLEINQYTFLENVFLEYKKKYAEPILIIECGYRYLFFDSDAQIVSSILNIQCSKTKNLLSASIPIHRLYIHLNKLVNSGKIVAVISQNQHFAKSNIDMNLIERHLFSLYTRPTLISDLSLNLFNDYDMKNNYDYKNNDPGSLVCILVNGNINTMAINFDQGTIICDRFNLESDFNASSKCFKTFLNGINTTEILISGTIPKSFRQFITNYQKELRDMEDGKEVRIHYLNNCHEEQESIREYLVKRLQQFNSSFDDNDSNIAQFIDQLKPQNWTLNQDEKLVFFALVSAILQYLDTGFLFLPEIFVEKFIRYYFDNPISLFPPLDRRQRSDSRVYLNPSSQELAERLYQGILVDHLKTRTGRLKLREWVNYPSKKLSDLEDRLDAVSELVNYIRHVENENYSKKIALIENFLDFSRGILVHVKRVGTGIDGKHHQASAFENLLDIGKINNWIKHKSCKPAIFARLLDEILILYKLVKVLQCLPNHLELTTFSSSHLAAIFDNLIHLITEQISPRLKALFITSGLISIDALRKNDYENIFNTPLETFVDNTSITAIPSSLKNILNTHVPQLNELRFKKFELMDKLKRYVESCLGKFLELLSNNSADNNTYCPVLVNGKVRVPDIDTFFTENVNHRTCINLGFECSRTVYESYFTHQDWHLVNATKKLVRIKSHVLINLDREFNDWNDRFTKNFSMVWNEFLGCFTGLFHSHINKMDENIALLDCYMCLAHISSQKNYTKPFFMQHGNILHIESGLHPLRLHDNPALISNDTFMDVDSRRCLVLSGPNGSGKSFYLEQTCMLVLLAQIGCFVPAERYLSGVFNSILIKFNLSTNENIIKNTSLGYAELLDTSTLLNDSDEHSLILMDDFGLSTSLLEAQALSYAITMYLINKVKCLTLIVTHFPLVTEISDTHPEFVVNCHMATIFEETFLTDDTLASSSQEHHPIGNPVQLSFLYKCVDGISRESHGFDLASKIGLKTKLLKRAHDVATRKREEDGQNLTIMQKIKLLLLSK